MRLKTWTAQNRADEASKEVVPDISTVSIERLIELGLLALDREIRNLTTKSASGKLSPPDARDLRDHIKLLFELKDRENEFLKNLTDDQIQAIVKAINESQQNSGDNRSPQPPSGNDG